MFVWVILMIVLTLIFFVFNNKKKIMLNKLETKKCQEFMAF